MSPYIDEAGKPGWFRHHCDSFLLRYRHVQTTFLYFLWSRTPRGIGDLCFLSQGASASAVLIPIWSSLWRIFSLPLNKLTLFQERPTTLTMSLLRCQTGNMSLCDFKDINSNLKENSNHNFIIVVIHIHDIIIDCLMFVMHSNCNCNKMYVLFIFKIIHDSIKLVNKRNPVVLHPSMTDQTVF